MTKKILSVLTGLLIFLSATRSQPPGYAMQPASGTYTAITGGTILTITSGDYDDGYVNGIPIGFTFNYNGTNYTTIGASANGWVSFGTIATTSSTNAISTGGNRPILAVLYEDLNISNSSNFTYTTTGVSGSRVFTLQWANVLWDYAATTPCLSMQLKLYEGTNIIEYVYRQEAGAVQLNNSGGASIGITKNTTGANSYWSLSDASANPAVSATTATDNIPVRPATGQIYRWIPYCAASATNTTGEKISNFTYNTINNNSASTAGYVDYGNVATTVNLTPTSSLPFSATISNFVSTDQVIIYIDYNHNGDFSDPGETVFTSTTPLAQGSVSGTINVPALSSTVLQGPTRLRIRLHDTGNGPNATSCGTSTAGQVQDYIVNIQPCFAAAITTQPANTFICNNGNGTITVAATGTGLTYQWQVSSDGGSTWSNVPATTPYSGGTTTSLNITGATQSMNAYKYRVQINGTCSPLTTSNAATITINTAAAITTNPQHISVCSGKDVSFSGAASGSSPTYQWQSSTDNGITFSNISGATSSTFTISGTTTALDGNRYRIVASVAACGSVNSSPAILTVNALPTVTISAAPLSAIKPGVTTFLSAGSVPTAVNYSWTMNGVVIPGANSHAITVNAANVGAYRVTVTDINGCQNTSSSVTITADPSDKFWIYPNPSTGKFTVRLYSAWRWDIRTVSIYNALGEIVLRKEFTINANYDEMNFDMSRFEPGVYMIHLTHRYVDREIVGRVVIVK